MVHGMSAVFLNNHLQPKTTHKPSILLWKIWITCFLLKVALVRSLWNSYRYLSQHPQLVWINQNVLLSSFLFLKWGSNYFNAEGENKTCVGPVLCRKRHMHGQDFRQTRETNPTVRLHGSTMIHYWSKLLEKGCNYWNQYTPIREVLQAWSIFNQITHVYPISKLGQSIVDYWTHLMLKTNTSYFTG